MFIAALYTIAKHYKHPKCPPGHKQSFPVACFHFCSLLSHCKITGFPFEVWTIHGSLPNALLGLGQGSYSHHVYKAQAPAAVPGAFLPQLDMEALFQGPGHTCCCPVRDRMQKPTPLPHSGLRSVSPALALPSCLPAGPRQPLPLFCVPCTHPGLSYLLRVTSYCLSSLDSEKARRLSTASALLNNVFPGTWKNF